MRKTKTSYAKSRLRDLLILLLQKHQSSCPLCHEPFDPETDVPVRGVDKLTEHHLNGVHEDSRLENRVIVHRTCHKKYHAKDNINSKERDFWRNFN